LLLMTLAPAIALCPTLPISTVKIDGSFFTKIETDLRSRKVIEVVTAFGHSLGLQIVAEGVETEAQYIIVRDVGCDLIQGFYFSRPRFGVDFWSYFPA
jgi:EAL domain-containing protein (putative c-di-GMP-specific phosphodiesterase class I)